MTDQLMAHCNNKLGWIELITGCMFAGKTEEFIRRLRRHDYAKHNVIAFKPSIDQRYSVNSIASHAGSMLPSFAIQNTAEIKTIFERENAKKPIDVVGIDEVQFLDTEIVDFIDELANRGIIVIVTGLDKNFKNEPFQNVDRLLTMAEFVEKLTAICHKCGNFANRTQRIVNGQPGKWNDPLILVSGEQSYEARCRVCYIIPPKY